MSVCLNFLVGAVLGFLSGLGIGGGSLLMLWLTLVCRMDYASSKYINLLFFLPPALIATAIRLLHKALNLRCTLLAAAAGCAAAALFTSLSSSWNNDLLRKLFGALLLCASLKELCIKKQKSPHS